MNNRVSFFLDRTQTQLRFIKNILSEFLQDLPYYGTGRWCPVCEKPSRMFRRYGRVKRIDAECIHCGALERHRFVWLYFSKRTNLFNGKNKTVLHVAPERCFESRLKKFLGDGYITADLMDPHAMIKVDITDIHYPECFFDVIYCSHVLEHVQADNQAMMEFYRILKHGGWAIILVPITCDRTIEDSTINGPLERLHVFGQVDHVRRYGPDIVDRLHKAGFIVSVTKAQDMFEKDLLILMGLTPASGEIYYCIKT